VEIGIKRIRKLVKRKNAEQYLLFTLLSFATTVILIRLFLNLTGYPQVGNDTLHIAHAVWGGLLLFIASLLSLLFANHWVYTMGALFAGAGMGLFVDEVGKFITQNNDYFFPAAAPIIYAVFLLTVLLYVQVRRPQPRNARTELYRALGTIEEVLDNDLHAQERRDLDARLRWVTDQSEHPGISRLASAIQECLASDTLYVAPDSPGLWERSLRRVRAYALRWITARRLKATLVGGLGLLGVGALVGPAVALIALVLAPAETIEVQLPNGSEPSFRPVLLDHLSSAALVGFLVRLALGVVVGLLLVVATVLLVISREQRGASLGYFGLLLSLTTVTQLDFYFDQFRAVGGALVYFALLLGVILYRRRYLLLDPEGNPPIPTSKISKVSIEPPQQ
jgi:hypothetical protein